MAKEPVRYATGEVPKVGDRIEITGMPSFLHELFQAIGARTGNGAQGVVTVVAPINYGLGSKLTPHPETGLFVLLDGDTEDSWAKTSDVSKLETPGLN